MFCQFMTRIPTSDHTLALIMRFSVDCYRHEYYEVSTREFRYTMSQGVNSKRVMFSAPPEERVWLSPEAQFWPDPPLVDHHRLVHLRAFRLLPKPEVRRVALSDSFCYQLQDGRLSVDADHLRSNDILIQTNDMAVDMEQRPLKVTIIGAGIAGLTAALALRKQGHVVTVCME